METQQQQQPQQQQSRKDVGFATMLDQRGCQSLKSAIEKFLKSFEKSTKGDVDVEVQTVHGLLHDIEQAMKARACWNTLPPALYQVALRDMHRYVYARLAPTIYVKREYMRQDDVVSRHHKELAACVTPEFLDLKPATVARKEFGDGVRILEQLDVYVTPEEKLNCIKEACNMLSRALPHDAGADDFLPLLIYAVLKAQLHSLQTNMEFVSRYVDPEEKFGEGYCFFTHLVSACTFLSQTKPEDVTKALRKQLSARRRVAILSMTADLDNLDKPLLHPVVAPACTLGNTAEAPESSTSTTSGNSAAATKTTTAVPQARPTSALYRDAELVRGLQFAQEDDAQLARLSGDRLRAFVAEYRQLVALARRCVPAVTTSATWARETELACARHELPAGTDVACMAADGARLWLGLRSGRVVVWDVAERRAVHTLAVRRTAVVALAVVRNAVWCALDNGTAYAVDRECYAVTKPLVTLHDKKYPRVRCLVYDKARDEVWSAAITTTTTAAASGATASGGASACATQLSRLASSSPVHQKTVVVPGKQAADLALFGGHVWVAYDSGDVVAYHPTTGAAVTTCGPFSSPVRLAVPTPDQLWLASGDTVRVHTAPAPGSSSSSSVASAPEFVTRSAGPVAFLMGTRIPWHAGAPDLCDAVLALGPTGAAWLWNCADTSCEAALAGADAATDGGAFTAAAAAVATASPGAALPPRSVQCFWAAARSNTLFVWAFT